MIITKLQGGLGNQLFQYALGRHLAEIHHTELKLDTTSFKTDPNGRVYDLGHFNVLENFATKEEVAKFQKLKRKPGKIWYLFNKLIAERKYIQQRQFHFDPRVLRTRNNIYLDGDWQTEKYFKDISDIIRKELTVKTPLSGKDKEVADAIAATTSVMMHIRRGDYVSDPISHQYFGTQGLDYYKKAMAIIAEKVPQPHVFVFSDDHAWVKEKIRLGVPTTYVDHNGADKNYEDLRLMSLCQYHIIANSTFSWWGAWLSQNPNKIVIGPERWFNNPKKKTTSAEDVLPEGWIRL